MIATHTDYKHPKHLRVVDGGQVLCVAPSASIYAKLNKAGLPRFAGPAVVMASSLIDYKP